MDNQSKTILPPQQTSVNLKCRHCGHEGDDVAWSYGYIGGHGYELIPYCTDITACWHRHDKEVANGTH